MTLSDGRTVYFIVTCEHAYPDIPDSCVSLLSTYVKEVETHRVFDPGALPVAEALAERLNAPLHKSRYTRLAIDLNRSLGAPEQFASPVARASEVLKSDLVHELYRPFRAEVEQSIARAIESGSCVIHLSVHTFTKVYEGVRRAVDVGILFDRDRPEEAAVGKRWTRVIAKILPDFVCRANEPYDGASDGHTTALRRRFSSHDYLGFEIELSQNLELEQDAENWAKLLHAALRKTIET